MKFLLFDKLYACLRRDLVTASRYRCGILMQMAAFIAQLVGFYLLARAIGAKFRPDGLDYYSFLLVGTGAYGFIIVGVNSFINKIKEEQLNGTLEALLTTATPPLGVLLLNNSTSLLLALLSSSAYVGAGVMFCRGSVHADIASVFLTVLLSFLLSIALGLLGAALQIATQRGASLLWLFGSVSWLFSGTMFPVSSLPAPLRIVASSIPITYSLTAFRMGIMQHASVRDLAQPLTFLAVSCAVLLPLSVRVLSSALRTARLRGTLGFY